jgi:hypothetical protein
LEDPSVDRKMKYNIKMSIKETGYEGMDFTHLARDRVQRGLVNTVTNLQVPKKKGHFLTS